MGVLSVLFILVTLYVLLSRKGGKLYKFLTAQSLLVLFIDLSLQISCLFYDIQLCFTICPHFVMQQLNGYVLGLFTVIGVSAKWQFIGLLFSLVQMYSSAYICIIFRHQSILPFRSTLKLHTKVEYLVTFFAFDIGHCAMCVTVGLFIENAEEEESSPPWLLARNSYVLPFDWSLFSFWVIGHIGGAFVVVIALISFTFWHMNYTLKETKKFLSPSTVYMQKLAVIALTSQCSVPMATVVFPMAIHCISIFLPSFDPNITCYLMFLFSSNSILSSIVIILSTPDYRRYIFRYFSGRRSTSVAIMKNSGKTT
ncbi:hypothetical protein PRIPAC_82933 [Pristionchus pacificus]|uniref:G protein-coupled receptor n=1 Tax=Pristionchus pacificus TaxID=54126 RepID=A0A2A6C3Q4_PRIPA|nr:hypothetical protein PRIPAC_82933 [Pristionchus pacificus]|eukprot:PDM72804.1 G protein-coupled receptor [Pristionchus pacificus]